jgi:hypothetical protein
LTAFAHHVFVLEQHGQAMFEFFPKGVAPAPDIFRSGARGTHSSRTMMLAEISNLVDANGLGRAREAVVESNALNKDSVCGAFDEVNLLSADGFNEIKHIEISGLARVVGSAVPEPSTWAMLVTGFGLMGLVGYRKTRSGNALA